MRKSLLVPALAAIAALGACKSACLVDSDPQGAAVSLDGKEVGKTPTSVKFANSGFRYSYEVRADLPGHESQIQHVQSHTDAWGRKSWPNMLFFRLRPGGAAARSAESAEKERP